jgi:hypothetical protein
MTVRVCGRVRLLRFQRSLDFALFGRLEKKYSYTQKEPGVCQGTIDGLINAFTNLYASSPNTLAIQECHSNVTDIDD